MGKKTEITRIDRIRLRLKRGDRKQIAAILGVHPVWVSYVLMGRGVSERVLLAAEQLINEREQTKSK